MSRLRERALPAMVLAAALLPAHAATYPMPPADQARIGDLGHDVVGKEDALVDVARRNRLGYEELKQANPEIDRWLPAEGTRVTLPTRYLLPSGPRRGIVVNVSEYRLYYYRPATKQAAASVMTYAVSAGREDWQTPAVETSVSRRLQNPAWYPPKTIRDEHRTDGRELPPVVPPGPGNPLGPLALKLSIPGGYFIHGSSKPFGVGMPVTHGCLRLYPEDMQELFAAVREGTPVRVVREPYKTAWLGEVLYVEAHPEPGAVADAVRAPIEAALRGHADYEVDWDVVRDIVLHASGVPTVVQRRSPVKAVPPP